MNTFRQRFALMVLSVAAAMPAAGFAQDFKMGFVNTERIFRDSTAAKQAQQRLEQEFGKRDKDLIEAGNALKASSEKFEREAPTLSDTQRQARQKILADQERDFQRKRREFQEDVNARRNQEDYNLREQAVKAIRSIAEKEKYDLVVQEYVYVNPKLDITDKVIKLLDSGIR